MNLNIHKDIEGGEEYLPFAMAQERKLRATGVAYLSKAYQVGDVFIDVRLEGEHSFIRIKKEEQGGYVCLPHSDTNPNGVTVKGTPPTPVRPEAVVKLFSAVAPNQPKKPKVTENKQVKAGLNDWRGKVGGKDRIITYTASPQRYRFFGASTQELPNLYDGGAVIETYFSLPGIGLDYWPVAGACIASNAEASFYVIAVKDYDRERLFICYRQVGTTDWKRSQEIAAPANCVFDAPVYFSPDGTKFNTIAVKRALIASTEFFKVSGTLSIQKTGSVYRVDTAHSTSGNLYRSIREDMISSPPPASVSEEIVGPTFDSTFTVSGANMRFYVTPTLVRTMSAGPSVSGSWRSYEVPIAFDYDSTSNEIPVRAVVSVEESTEYSNVSTTFVTGPSTVSGTELLSITGGNESSGDPTALGARTSAANWAISVIQSGPVSNGYNNYKRRSLAEIYTGSKKVGTVTWLDISQNTFATYHPGYGDALNYLGVPGLNYPPNGALITSGRESDITLGHGQFLALDARTDASVLVTTESKPTNPDDSTSVCTRKVSVDMRFGSQTKSKEWALPVGLALYKEPGQTGVYAGAPHMALNGQHSTGNYASRDSKTFMFSASPDDVIADAIAHTQEPPPKTDQSLIWLIGDQDNPQGLFSIGREPDFGITPIKIF